MLPALLSSWGWIALPGFASGRDAQRMRNPDSWFLGTSNCGILQFPSALMSVSDVEPRRSSPASFLPKKMRRASSFLTKAIHLRTLLPADTKAPSI
jgi:hypothetical protein